MDNNKNTLTRRLPESFRPLFWSYDFDELDPNKHKNIIIINTINYGDLKQWKWLRDYYGAEAVRDVLAAIPATELRPQVARLAQIIFNLAELNYASRGTH